MVAILEKLHMFFRMDIEQIILEEVRFATEGEHLVFHTPHFQAFGVQWEYEKQIPVLVS